MAVLSRIAIVVGTAITTGILLASPALADPAVNPGPVVPPGATDPAVPAAPPVVDPAAPVAVADPAAPVAVAEPPELIPGQVTPDLPAGAVAPDTPPPPCTLGLMCVFLPVPTLDHDVDMTVGQPDVPYEQYVPTIADYCAARGCM